MRECVKNWGSMNKDRRGLIRSIEIWSIKYRKRKRFKGLTGNSKLFQKYTISQTRRLLKKINGDRRRDFLIKTLFL